VVKSCLCLISLIFIYSSLQYMLELIIKGKKKKVQLSLCLTNYALRDEGVGGVDVLIHVFLTSTLVGGEWSASRPGCFSPGERAWYSLHTILGGAQNWRKFLTIPGLEIRPLCRPAHSKSLYRQRWLGCYAKRLCRT
jgi:hypothetical protein